MLDAAKYRHMLDHLLKEGFLLLMPAVSHKFVSQTILFSRLLGKVRLKTITYAMRITKYSKGSISNAHSLLCRNINKE